MLQNTLHREQWKIVFLNYVWNEYSLIQGKATQLISKNQANGFLLKMSIKSKNYLKILNMDLR